MLGGMGAAFLRGHSQSTQVTGVVQWDDLAARMGFIERVWRGLVFLPQSCTMERGESDTSPRMCCERQACVGSEGWMSPKRGSGWMHPGPPGRPCPLARCSGLPVRLPVCICPAFPFWSLGPHVPHVPHALFSGHCSCFSLDLKLSLPTPSSG